MSHNMAPPEVDPRVHDVIVEVANCRHRAVADIGRAAHGSVRVVDVDRQFRDVGAGWNSDLDIVVVWAEPGPVAIPDFRNNGWHVLVASTKISGLRRICKFRLAQQD